MSLFDSQPEPQVLELPNADIRIWHGWLSSDEQAALFAELRDGLAWEQSTIFIHGRECRIPRLNAWYGDPGARYAYSGTRFEPIPFTETLNSVKARIEQTTAGAFNSLLANYYRDGADSVGWHSDDEPELGPNPTIASLSLGNERKFQLKPRRGEHERVDLLLPPGSLLLMQGPTQHAWSHQIPKTKRPVGERINLTFRYVRMLSP